MKTKSTTAQLAQRKASRKGTCQKLPCWKHWHPILERRLAEEVRIHPRERKMSRGEGEGRAMGVGGRGTACPWAPQSWLALRAAESAPVLAHAPQSAHPHSDAAAPRMESSWSSRRWSPPTRRGRRPRCHSAPAAGGNTVTDVTAPSGRDCRYGSNTTLI